MPRRYPRAGWRGRSMIEQARRLGLAMICPQAGILDGELVDRLHQKGFIVRVWGAGDEDVMRRVVEAGADGMTVDFPDKLASFIDSR